MRIARIVRRQQGFVLGDSHFYLSRKKAHLDAPRHGFTHTQWNGRVRACPPLRQYTCRQPNCKKLTDERGGLCKGHSAVPRDKPHIIIDEASSIPESVYNPEVENQHS